ncbi:MAG: Tetratricopeptide repeat protein [Elusimicrobia bacterium ADurb.Bin231]|nr:MAG: Tetratricopeptide repeat protein [Elusimicrobia bacterium ADurb.Bin231]
MTVLKPWDVFHQAKIVPANLKHYKGILDIVKLEGRSIDTSKIISQVINYSTNLNSYEYPDNAYRPLAYPFYHPYSIKQEPASVFEMVSKCKNDCDNCGYCEKIWLEYYGLTKDVYYCIDGYRKFHKKRYKEAIESFEKYLSSRNKTDGSLYYHLGLCYRYVNDVEKAIFALEKAVQLNISEWILYNFLGSLYRDKGDFPAAEKSLLEAIRLQPDEWSNYNVLGNIYSFLHQREEALKMYEKALSFNPEAGYAGRILENINRIKGT